MASWMLPGVSWLPLLVAWLFAAGQGELFVTSQTEGAEVFVDGRLVGRVPVRAAILLPAGQHTVKITKRGYTDFLDVVTVRAERRTPVDVDLLPVSGVLRVAVSVPGARVFVDGRFVGESGQTPLLIDVDAGRRSGRVEKGGYRDFLAIVEAVAGRTDELLASLAELPPTENPFRPPPPAPLRWYEHWYVWASGAAV